MAALKVLEGGAGFGRGGSKIGLALAGGGPAGAVYEIGALRALDEAIEGLDLNDLHVYVGVSAGAFIAACLANGVTPERLCRTIASDESDEGPFAPGNFLAPALGELGRRAAMVPGLLFGGLWDYLRAPGNYSIFEPALRLSRALPVGVFDSRRIATYLHGVFTREGRTDDFRRLDRRLVVVASDLDSGHAVRFGEPGLDHIPISRAVQASVALPGFFAPVTIEGRSYVDGVLLKTVHASVGLETGAELMVALNPIVPVDTSRAVEAGVMKRGKLVDRGLATVLSQTLRTLIRSRLEAGMAKYESQFRGSDVVLLEPRSDDYRMFFTNIFSFAERLAVCEHAYRRTRRNLLDREGSLRPVLERHGLVLRTDVLADPDRTVWDCLEPGATPAGGGRRRLFGRRTAGSETAGFETAVTARLDRALDRLDDLLDADPDEPRTARGAA